MYINLFKTTNIFFNHRFNYRLSHKFSYALNYLLNCLLNYRFNCGLLWLKNFLLFFGQLLYQFKLFYFICYSFCSISVSFFLNPFKSTGYTAQPFFVSSNDLLSYNFFTQEQIIMSSHRGSIMSINILTKARRFCKCYIFSNNSIKHDIIKMFFKIIYNLTINTAGDDYKCVQIIPLNLRVGFKVCVTASKTSKSSLSP